MRNEQILLTIRKISTAVILMGTTVYQAQAFSQTIVPTGQKSSPTFQKTDTSLLYEIETNLESYKIRRSSGGYLSEKPKKPPKQRRFELAKKGISKLIYKNSMPNSVLGAAIGTIATSHPAGLILGGFAGVLQGKSDRYEEAQGKIHAMEKEIYASGAYEVTSEEIRLAKYTGADLSEFLALPPTPEVSQNKKTEKILPKLAQTPEIEVIPPPSPPDVDYCHDLTMGNTKPIDNATRRELVTFCMYHMN